VDGRGGGRCNYRSDRGELADMAYISAKASTSHCRRRSSRSRYLLGQRCCFGQCEFGGWTICWPRAYQMSSYWPMVRQNQPRYHRSEPPSTSPSTGRHRLRRDERMGLQLMDGATAQCSIVFRSNGDILLQSGVAGGTTLATFREDGFQTCGRGVSSRSSSITPLVASRPGSTEHDQLLPSHGPEHKGRNREQPSEPRAGSMLQNIISNQ
jgi:hypothetical protein